MAWAASIWLVLGPAYQGVSLTIEGTTRVSATFIETNGLHVIWVPIVPVLLSGIALMAVRRTGPGPTERRLLLWSISVVFLGFWGSAPVAGVWVARAGLFFRLPLSAGGARTDHRGGDRLGSLAQGSGRRSSGLKRMMSRWRRGSERAALGDL